MSGVDYRHAVALGAAVAVLLASVVDPPTAEADPTSLFGVGLDKYLHLLGYAAVAGSLAWARRATGWALLAVVCVTVAYGAGIELLQATLPARSFDPLDGLANAVGACVGAVWWRIVRRNGGERPA